MSDRPDDLKSPPAKALRSAEQHRLVPQVDAMRQAILRHIRINDKNRPFQPLLGRQRRNRHHRSGEMLVNRIADSGG